ncbi:hypothetical protein OG21DRAFT_1514510 [Imleria badia]|nr:hypothetical protein OG21DRAFT_1514510 [Imleria badia]
MHHALEIQEILLNIFGHCYSANRWRDATSDLASLARTCRAFKEPALDLLWEHMVNLSPLVQCLADVSHQLIPDEYSFTRSLTRIEWDILRSYTRRIRSIQQIERGLDWESVTTFLNPPTTVPLFPNLRTLHCEYTEKTMHLLHLPLPSLVFLHVEFENPRLFQNSLKAFPNFSPNIRTLCIGMRPQEATVSKIEPNYFCRWQNLCTAFCPSVVLDADTLVHLSSIPALTQLTFTLSTTLPTSHSPIFFSNLRYLTLYSKCLRPISWLLSWIRLPAITEFIAVIENCPSRKHLITFFAGVQTSSAGRTIERLSLNQCSDLPSNVVRSEALLLSFEDLQPCMALSNLRSLRLNIEWNVSLTDTELLALASSWPHLEEFIINPSWGWNTLAGITLNGLAQLLQTCLSLRWISLAIKTRNYTASGSLASLGLILRPRIYINVLDSIIEAESVSMVGAFFAGIASCSSLTFGAWRGLDMVIPPGWEVYADRWDEVFRCVNDTVSRHS